MKQDNSTPMRSNSWDCLLDLGNVRAHAARRRVARISARTVLDAGADGLCFRPALSRRDGPVASLRLHRLYSLTPKILRRLGAQEKIGNHRQQQAMHHQ